MEYSFLFPLVEELWNRPRSARVIVENTWFFFYWTPCRTAYCQRNKQTLCTFLSDYISTKRARGVNLGGRGSFHQIWSVDLYAIRTPVYLVQLTLCLVIGLVIRQTYTTVVLFLKKTSDRCAELHHIQIHGDPPNLIWLTPFAIVVSESKKGKTDGRERGKRSIVVLKRKDGKVVVMRLWAWFTPMLRYGCFDAATTRTHQV